MGFIFRDDLHDELGSWPLAYVPYGGADLGEVMAIGREVADGNDEAFFNAWTAAGDRLFAEAESAMRRGQHSSARDAFLRASVFYGKSYHPLYGAPVDPRLLAGYRLQISAFEQGLALSDVPVFPSRVPFEGTTMPAYFVPAQGLAEERRPLVIFTNGYDATVTDLYFASALAASKRGYQSLIFDGPDSRVYLDEGCVATLLDSGKSLAPCQLILQIDIDELDLVRPTLQRFHVKGIVFAIVGVRSPGSLSSLKSGAWLAFCRLDREVMGQEEHDRNDTRRSMVSASRQTAMPLMADGLESVGQYRAVSRSGITLAQGYFLHRAVPPSQLATFLEQPRSRALRASAVVTR